MGSTIKSRGETGNEYRQHIKYSFFIVGLAIGLLQLYIGQHQFEVQQREKMDELRRILTEIQQRLAVVEETTSQRMFEVQGRLIALATREEAVTEFTEDAAKQIRSLVANELKDAGVQDSVKLSKSIESKLSQILEKSAHSLVEYSETNIDRPYKDVAELLTTREKQVAELICEEKSRQEISEILMISVSTIDALTSHLYRKLGVKNRSELANIISIKPKGTST